MTACEGRYDQWPVVQRRVRATSSDRTPLSYYLLADRYRFAGVNRWQAPRPGPSGNNRFDAAQPSPTHDVEGSGLSDLPRDPAALGGPGRHRVPRQTCARPGRTWCTTGRLHTPHCTNSTSRTYDGDQWVRVEVLATTATSWCASMIDGSDGPGGTSTAADRGGQVAARRSRGQGGRTADDRAATSRCRPRPPRWISGRSSCSISKGANDPRASNYKSYIVKREPVAMPLADGILAVVLGTRWCLRRAQPAQGGPTVSTRRCDDAAAMRGRAGYAEHTASTATAV